jgi:hypothetical protein
MSLVGQTTIVAGTVARRCAGCNLLQFDHILILHWDAEYYRLQWR